jgi:RNA polymerase sigma-70 factor (ECF subfamily)
MSAMLTTPVTLLERLRRPDEPDAWDRFVELYTPMLYAWARKTGLQEPDAADLVQEVFALLLRKLPEFAYDPAKSFRGWLRTVTLNQWRLIQRRRAGQPTTAQGVEPDALPAAEGEAFWEAEYRQHLVARALAVMRAEFQPTTWRACWECAVHGRPAADVAAEFGLSVGAVRAAKFRVLNRLRQELDGLLE